MMKTLSETTPSHQEKLCQALLRFQSDKRQLGGILMTLGLTALTFPMVNVASWIGPENSTASSGIPLSSLIAGLCVIVIGLVSTPLGYLQAVHDYSNPTLTAALIFWTQLAWMPFLTDLTAVGKALMAPIAFGIPTDRSDINVKLIGSMGLLGIFGYGIGFLGSLAFVEFALLAFQKGRPEDRTGKYYRSRLTLYAFCNVLVGVSQLTLGVYIYQTLGSGPLGRPVVVAMYRIYFPEISIAVGSIQCGNAAYGVLRSFGTAVGGPDDHSFQWCTLIQWLCTVTLQIVTQIAYSPGELAAATAPSLIMLTLGLNMIVSFLDYKGRTVPDIIPAEYYGLATSSSKDTFGAAGGGWVAEALDNNDEDENVNVNEEVPPPPDSAIVDGKSSDNVHDEC